MPPFLVCGGSSNGNRHFAEMRAALHKGLTQGLVDYRFHAIGRDRVRHALTDQPSGLLWRGAGVWRARDDWFHDLRPLQSPSANVIALARRLETKVRKQTRAP